MKNEVSRKKSALSINRDVGRLARVILRTKAQTMREASLLQRVRHHPDPWLEKAAVYERALRIFGRVGP